MAYRVTRYIGGDGRAREFEDALRHEMTPHPYSWEGEAGRIQATLEKQADMIVRLASTLSERDRDSFFLDHTRTEISSDEL